MTHYNQHCILRVLAFVALISFSATGTLHAAEDVRWPDLTVPILPDDDPAYGLTFEQRQHLETLLSVSANGKEGFADNQTNVERATAELAKHGLSGKLLLEKERRFRKKIALQRSTLRDEWDNKDIRIPGYVLPLESDGDRVTEFILVPYAGACVHVPPPPANQMIIVRLATGFRVTGLFDPVWVTGTLRLARSSQPVALSDGSMSFDVGYAMDAASVRHYQQ